MASDEPSYLAFARVAAKDSKPIIGPTLIRELVDRIDRDTAALKAAKPRTITTAKELDALKLPAIIQSPSGGPLKVEYYVGPGRRKYVEPIFGDDDEADESYSITFFAEFGLPATVIHEAQS